MHFLSDCKTILLSLSLFLFRSLSLSLLLFLLRISFHLSCNTSLWSLCSNTWQLHDHLLQMNIGFWLLSVVDVWLWCSQQQHIFISNLLTTSRNSLWLEWLLNASWIKSTYITCSSVVCFFFVFFCRILCSVTVSLSVRHYICLCVCILPFFFWAFFKLPLQCNAFFLFPPSNYRR